MIKKLVLIAFLLLPIFLFSIDWTVMVYMCADNSMNEQSYVDISEMMQVGSTAQVKIVVQIDNLMSSIEPGCHRYLITKNNKELIASLGETDMANPQTLIDFVRFARWSYPAQKYLLILWDHANGWPVGTYYAYKDKAIIYDQSSNNWIGVADGELKHAITEIKNILGKKISILAFDACLMAMAEVADEISDGADIIFASEDLTPWDGLPYQDILSYLTTNNNTSAKNLSKNMVDLAVNSYNNGSQGNNPCTFSAIDLSLFIQARNNFGQNLLFLTQSSHTQAMQNARAQSQTFSIEHNPPTSSDDYLDLIDFLYHARNAITNQTDRDKINNTITRFESCVIEHKNVGAYLNNAKGISIWFPDNYLTFKYQYKDYQNLNWAKKVNWLSFLNNYFSADDIKPNPVTISSSAIGIKNNFTLFWSRSYDLASIRYNIKEIKTMSTIFSDDCNDFTHWTSAGFSISVEQAHSSNKSFYSGYGNSINNILTLVNPISLPDGGLLSFWSYYETEENYRTNYAIKRDVFYVEISANGIDYLVLDSFYGSNRTWGEHRYLLDNQETLYLRFRYVTDASISRLGVYLDHINIITFSGVRNITNNIADTNFNFFNLNQDTYYYLITPTDSFGNIGYTSQAYKISIRTFAEPYSLPAPFFTDCKIYCDYPLQAEPDLYIYTLNGELIRKFTHAQFNNNLVYWDGCNQNGQAVASGLFLVLIKAPNFTRLGKIAKAR